jgi:choline dehydrogenase-like flavoprotein
MVRRLGRTDGRRGRVCRSSEHPRQLLPQVRFRSPPLRPIPTDPIADPSPFLSGLTQTDFDWQYTTEVQPDANGTTKYWPRGKGLGGSGAINGLFWVRGAEEEYDAWDTLNPGSSVNWKWSGDDGMQHYINKASRVAFLRFPFPHPPAFGRLRASSALS